MWISCFKEAELLIKIWVFFDNYDQHFITCISMISDKNDLHTLMVLVKLRCVNVQTAGQTTSLPIDGQQV